MPVVSDTSPLLNLSIIGQLNLISNLHSEVLIPEAVQNELQVDSNLPGSAALRNAMENGWLKLVAATNIHTIQALRFTLDRGESEAIALALEKGITQIFLDENDGRAMARLMGLQPVGILGILLKAKQNGFVPAVKPLIYQLRVQAGFFISPMLESQILQAAGE